MKKKKVSIIVPIYNGEAYLERCVQSLVNQTYSDIEIILINDGSTDKTHEICERYAELEKRIVYIKKKNTGVSDTRNYGIRRSTGDYILFVDSDDYIGKETVEKLMDFSNDATLVSVGHYDVVSENAIENKYKKNKYSGNEIIDKIVSSEIKGITCGYLFKKSKLKNMEFDTNSSYLEDMLFLISFLKNNVYKKIVYLECSTECADYYYHHDKSVTISKSNIIEKGKMIFKTLDKINNLTNSKYISLINDKKIMLTENLLRTVKNKKDLVFFTEQFKIEKYNGKSLRYMVFSILYRNKMHTSLMLYYCLRRTAKKILKHNDL